jgi:hypothetical protein
MLLSSTSSTPTRFDPFPSRIAPRKSFFVHILRSTPGPHYADSNLLCTNLTTKHQKTSKHLSPLKKIASNTLHQTSITQILPNRPYTYGRIVFMLAWQAFLNSFPIINWCCLTTQCNTTLNMLQPCHKNSLLLAHKVLEGSFSFNVTSMAPLGTEVLVHMKLNC